MNLTIGSRVHFVLETGEHRPATVTKVSPDRRAFMTVQLALGDIPGKRDLMKAAVPHDSTGRTPGSWHWPEAE